MRKHNACCGVLSDWLEARGCHVQREVVLPTAHDNQLQSRMDLIVFAPPIDGPIYIDLTVVNAASREALARGSADHEGVAASIATDRKRRAYPNIPVTPFVIEDSGRLGELALKLVRKVAPADPTARSTAISELYQSLGATLQRQAANAVLASMAPRI